MTLRHLALGVLLAASVPTHAPKMRGICWEGAGPIGPTALAPLKELGVEWISQTPFGWAPSLTSTEVRYRPDGGLWGETDEGLSKTTAWAHELGIKTLLKPHLWVHHGDWSGDIAMATPEDWARWFASYEAFIVHYAKLAESSRIEALAIGTELGKASARTADWKRLIARVREVYHGKLTYCANWNDETERVGFWNELDFIGVQAYYPLATVDRPSMSQIEEGWKPIASRLASLAQRTGKSVVFTEIGFKSVQGSLKEPWRWETAGETDLALQRDAFDATFATFWSRTWFGGVFVWKWHPSPRAPGRDDRDFTPQGKPALSVIKSYFTGR